MMKSYNYFKAMVMVMAMLSLGLVTSASMAGNFEKIAGQFNQTYSKQEVLPVPQAQGHIIMLTQSKGKGTSTNGSGYMDGAQVVINEIVDLNQGNGPHSGYVTQTMPNGDETVTRFTGQVSTILTSEGQPNTTFSGRWENVSGAGQYTGITGSGTYNGHFVSEKEYVVDWEGYYFLQ
ncbi:MAG: hypothetical protein HY356_02665 [Gammaproteobacteria bacterium]|nr:hypothetical protein [Gammaproteobacteria bacterium]